MALHENKEKGKILRFNADKHISHLVLGFSC